MTVKAELREQIEADIVRRAEVTSRNMMGTTAYMVRGRMFAFWVADGLVAKLPDHARQELLDRRAGVLFQGPQGRGFGDWTNLTLDKDEDVAAVLEGVKSAFEYIRGAKAPASKAKRKKR
ncbi:MAG: TfoX/Sxy family protein [Dehalococcoidia bacterium]